MASYGRIGMVALGLPHRREQRAGELMAVTRRRRRGARYSEVVWPFERRLVMAWNLEGMFYENCSCSAICPCTWSNLAHRATRDYCRFALAFRVDSGDIEGVDVS